MLQRGFSDVLEGVAFNAFFMGQAAGPLIFPFLIRVIPIHCGVRVPKNYSSLFAAKLSGDS